MKLDERRCNWEAWKEVIHTFWNGRETGVRLQRQAYGHWSSLQINLTKP